MTRIQVLQKIELALNNASSTPNPAKAELQLEIARIWSRVYGAMRS